MSPTIQYPGPTLSDREIAAFERRLDARLPHEYRTFLQECNGGIPDACYFSAVHERLLVQSFNRLAPGRRDDIETIARSYEGRIPSSFLPFAVDPQGSLFLISLREGTRGRVYFWDQEREPESPTDELASFTNVYEIAPTFGEFLGALYASQ